MHKKANRLLVGIISFLSFSVMNCWADNLPRLNVLLIHSYHQDYPWTSGQNKAFKQSIQDLLPDYHFDFTTEYLNTKQIAPTAKYRQSFIEYARIKYAENLPDLIYVTDDNAVNFVLNAVKNIPLIFSGVNNLQLLEKDRPANVTGVFEYKSLQKNIELLSALNLKFDTVLSVGDGGASDQEIIKQLHLVKDAYPNLTIKHIADNRLSQLIAKINEQPPAPILVTSIGKLTDDNNNLVSVEKVIEQLGQTNRIIIVTEDGYLLSKNNHVLGGYLTTSTAQGKAAATLAAQTIREKSAEHVEPLQDPPVELMLDWLVLEKLNSPLPAELLTSATILNQPQPFFDRYPKLIFWIVGALLIMLAAGSMIFILMSKRKNQVIKDQATDKLTGLTNRIGLIHSLQYAKNPVIAVLDIDNFNGLNHFYGIDTGDSILKNVAQQLKAFLLAEVAVFRMGSDQFVLLTENKGNSCLYNIMPDLIAHLEQHNFIEHGVGIGVSFTAGISSINAKAPLIEASTALVHAKSKSLRLATYEKKDSVVEQQKKNIMWGQKLRQALAEDRVRPFYQVIVNNKSGKAEKVEALVRLIDDDGSVVSPFYFLDAAKKSHQYEELTRAVITHSLKEVATSGMVVTINFTIEDTQNPDTISFLKQQIEKYNCGNRVIVELTEGEGIENYQEAAAFIRDIKKLGCKVAIDDFGTGYSNFMHIISLNADILKIDGSIVQALPDDPNAEILIKTIVSFAKQLGMETVAEYVDSQYIFDKVTEIGVDYSQGFFFGKPEPRVCHEMICTAV